MSQNGSMFSFLCPGLTGFGGALQALFATALLASAAKAQADVSEALNYRYYSGAIEPDAPLYSSLLAASSIRENGKIYFGHTAWQITWDLNWRRDSAGRCTLERIRTHLKATITLPQKAANDPRAPGDFERFATALREHELHHRDIARKAARAIDDRIWQSPAMRTCGELEAAANGVGQGRLDETRQRGAAYDEQTAHGCAGGAHSDRVSLK